MDRIVHDSDCATHNMPAEPNGECNCGARPLIDIIKFAEHVHIASENNIDTCFKCGHDIRHPIHARVFK